MASSQILQFMLKKLLISHCCEFIIIRDIPIFCEYYRSIKLRFQRTFVIKYKCTEFSMGSTNLLVHENVLCLKP